ncbi:4Fe-4S ferredoxin [Bacillus sp. SA1-12]|uniref:4Fe-4S dicluster domain-containing protein n=1 Tax=Bacillus sp. SA1-12 TaxID=1455638 RepID=UPI000627255B|nr:ferredoxin family protein [Bacillus sp. SA1-12]KKI90486.1 4Fe-4S ferredoxin [Bacillus sp. SA1-12]
MIEVVSKSRCIECNQCIAVCPTNVFEKGTDGYPVISRKDDCQTCFMCELYCPADALYVSPKADEYVSILENDVVENGLLGSYRESIGWGRGRKSTAVNDGSYIMFREINKQNTK